MEKQKTIKVLVFHGIRGDGIHAPGTILERIDAACEKAGFETPALGAEFEAAKIRCMIEGSAKGFTVVVDPTTGAVGYSVCHEADRFSRKAGLLVALNRLCNRRYPGIKRCWVNGRLLLDDGLIDPDIREILRRRFGIGKKHD